MAPKKPFKVHSLNQHIEDTKKGLSAEAQYNKRPAKRPAATVKKEAQSLDNTIFGNQDDDDSASESDDSSSSDTSVHGVEYLTKLAPKKSEADQQPLPGAKPKRDAQKQMIAGSDTEKRTDNVKNASAKKAKPTPAQVSTSESSSGSESSSESGSDSESESASEQKVDRSNGAPLKQSTTTSATSSTSSDSDSDEDSGSDDSDDEVEKSASKPAKQTQKAATKPPQKLVLSEASSDEESDSESEDPGKSTASNHVNGKAATSTSASGTNSDSEEESSDEEEEADESIHMMSRQTDGRSAPNVISSDFVLHKTDGGSQAADVARICSEASTQGKQFWYFTVPANVPISVVHNLEIPIDQGQKSQSVFSHAGENYGISFDSMTPKSSIQILIPSSNGSQYQPGMHATSSRMGSVRSLTLTAGSRAIDQVMQIKRITQVGDSIPSASPVGPSEKPPPRQQPKGLKARFQPIGVTSPMGKIGAATGSDVDEDDEMPDASTPHKASKAEKKDKKRKEKESKHGDTPRKNKRKHTTSEDEAAAAAEQLMEETQTAETKSKKQRTGSPDLGSGSPAKNTNAAAASNVAPSPKMPGSSRKSNKVTPVPVPRQTTVPIPHVPNSARKSTAVPVPLPGSVPTPVAAADAKKAKKKKSKTAKPASANEQSPPPSAQPQAKPTKTVAGGPVPTVVPKMSG